MCRELLYFSGTKQIFCEKCAEKFTNASGGEHFVAGPESGACEECGYLRYDGEYGEWCFDPETGKVEDKLDRKTIWEAAEHDFIEQQRIFSEILDEAGIARIATPARTQNEFWAGEATDLGFAAILRDGRRLVLDSEGTHVLEDGK